ncbi:hypothetical protein Q5752_003836 [Cryptotrichosporon argae]
MGHKRSLARLISTPTPTAASSLVLDSPEKQRFTGDAMVSSDGYSSLFTSGLFRTKNPDIMPLPTPRARPSEPPSTPRHPAPPPPPSHRSPYTPRSPHTPRRRRSSIVHATPTSVSPRVLKTGPDNGVERALEGVMRSLKIAATPRTPRTPRHASATPRSKWSDDSDADPRRWSGESARSAKSAKSAKSLKSLRSVRSRLTARSARSSKGLKTEAEPTASMNIDDVPPVPQTPKSSRRMGMVNGLARKLGLTPKRSKTSTSMPPPPLPAPSFLPPLPPFPIDRAVPRKGSLTTLRSVCSVITKKGSSTTLRSVRTVAPGDVDALPPMPPRWADEVGDGCIPSTPPRSGRRTPKSSIGPPRPQPQISPSKFLREVPRRAPRTPNGAQGADDAAMETPDAADLARVLVASEDVDMAVDEVATKGYSSRYGTAPFALDADFSTLPSRSSACDDDALNPANTSESRPSTSTDATDATDATDESFGHCMPYTPGGMVLTAKAARAAAAIPTTLSKHQRLLQLLPRHTPKFEMDAVPPTPALRTKKSTIGLAGSASLPALSSSGLPIAKPSAAAPRRDPLGILRSAHPNIPRASNDDADAVPFRAGAGDGWSTPMPVPDAVKTPTKRRSRASSYFSGHAAAANVAGTGVPASSPRSPRSSRSTHTFGRAASRVDSHRSRPSGPDFTRTPPSSPGTTVTDEWVLEQYLQED